MKLLVLDCRAEWEWRHGRIPGGKPRPMAEIPQRLPELDRDLQIVMDCTHGLRSYALTASLSEQGFQARNLSGFMVCDR